MKHQNRSFECGEKMELNQKRSALFTMSDSIELICAAFKLLVKNLDILCEASEFFHMNTSFVHNEFD